jgi:hypothetical protein
MRARFPRARLSRMIVIPFKQRDLFTRRWRNVVGSEKEVTSLHIPLVAMLRWCIKPTVIWRHVPNGEHRDKRTAAKLKAMGVLPGGADLEFFWKSYRDHDNAELHALFLELKLPGRKPTEEQAGFGLAMMTLGAEYHVVTSIDVAIEILGTRGLIRPDIEVCGRRWQKEQQQRQEDR